METVTKNKLHTEQTFETAVVSHLSSNGWIEGSAANFSRELCLDEKAVLEFLQTTQAKEWETFVQFYKSDAETQLIKRLVKEIDLKGMLEVVRHGITDSGVKFKLAYFKPDSKLNEETIKLYASNKLYVTRQVKYSTKNENSIDLLLSLNGLPIATVELKNQFTGQDVTNAKRQFTYDRDPRELLFQFKKRALVHFSVDPDEVYLTTKLDGGKTRFLPFNKGLNNGAGNPLNENGYRAAYLWEEVWEKDSWMNIVGRFLHLQIEDVVIDKKKYQKESMIFPRYHQLRAVRKLGSHALQNGSGQQYLIQHSAGSGKSNTIAWLAYKLSSLHDKTDKRIFDSIVVITDRTVLDDQLQKTIYQFEHKEGVVQKIDKDSTQLAEAITKGKDIIITTLQKFPFTLDKIKDLPDRNYAVIIDEAHSSQGGEASRKMKELLSAKTLDEAERADAESEETTDDYIREQIKIRGQQPNMSFFGFTATPKAKTIEVFGTKEKDGKPRPFDLYSMKQAIEENFILDVLKYYMTYKTFFRLNKSIEDDPLLNKKKAARAIGRFVSLHPHNLSQKSEVIIEHFRQVTMKKIGGRAKAMVVTSSRLHALRYYVEFKKYLQENKYHDIKPLVAFSGKVKDGEFPDGVTESELNGFGEKQLPERFDTDEYKILLVADKYQTGYDQPLLHTMYVDKKLSGVKAVQTLSRLNRMSPGKEDTFVLDFANEQDTIYQSFQPFYELTTLKENTDPNHLYDLRGKLDAVEVYQWSEINAFAEIFFKDGNHNVKDHSQLNKWIDPAKDRFKVLEETKQDEFKKGLTSFVRLYSFLSQILPFQDVELEKLYTYGRLLLTKLPKTDYIERLKLDNDVALEYYRLQKITEGSITLQSQGEVGLKTTTEAGIGRPKDERAKLSEIIDVLNEKFGTDFDKADKLFFDQIEEELFADETLKKQAQNNEIDNFKYGFEEVFIHKLIERMDENSKIFDRVMDSSDFKKTVQEWMLKKLFERFNKDKK
ncbi:MAG TPA: DEAD/DEAH box helicase family protein [Bacteroidia bacterium]|nr:DEAD/DEAH box helicase family protein [Bacteroidia bacterium]